MDNEYEKLRQIIADVLNLDPDEITMESTLTEDLGADSLDLFQIVTELSDEFEAPIDEEAASKVRTVGEALALLKEAIA